jgi:hypothetical protein
MIRREALEVTGEGGLDQESSSEEKKFLDKLLLETAEQEVDPKKLGPSPLQMGSKELLDHLQALLEDFKQGMALKRKAALFLEHRPTQEAADRVLEILSKNQDNALRFLLIQTLQRMGDRNPAIRWNRGVLKEEIFRELDLYQKIKKLSSFCFHSPQKPKKKEKLFFLEVALSAISDESLERLFRCLGLLYPGEALGIIYERLLEYEVPDPARSHAIELLQNLLGPEFFGVVDILSSEETREGVSEEEALTILEEMIESPDRWLSLTAHFLIIELGLESRSPKLGSFVSTHSFESLDL